MEDPCERCLVKVCCIKLCNAKINQNIYLKNQIKNFKDYMRYNNPPTSIVKQLRDLCVRYEKCKDFERKITTRRRSRNIQQIDESPI